MDPLKALNSLNQEILSISDELESIRLDDLRRSPAKNQNECSGSATPTESSTSTTDRQKFPSSNVPPDGSASRNKRTATVFAPKERFKGCGNVDDKFCKLKLKKDAKIRQYVRRNPITGEGIESANVKKNASLKYETDVLAVSAEKNDIPERIFGGKESEDAEHSEGESELFDSDFLTSGKPDNPIRRNPITGEGIGDNPKDNNFLRSGLRMIKPPGGTSFGIF